MPNQIAKSYKTRPIYTPAHQIRAGLYTEGKEWMDAVTYEEYIGLYHRYPNNSTYTQGTFVKGLSKLLIPYTQATQPSEILTPEGASSGITGSMNNSIYFKLTGKRFNNYRDPSFYYPDPTAEQYESGYIKRLFLQRINNENDIIEVNAGEFDKTNKVNKKGIDEGLYRKMAIDWSVVGPIAEVRKVNLSVIREAEKTMPGLSEYLTDLDEFHKESHKVKEQENMSAGEGKYTSGGEFRLPDGTMYEGPYHVHPSKGPMTGAKHSNQPHDILIPVNANTTTNTTGNNMQYTSITGGSSY